MVDARVSRFGEYAGVCLGAAALHLNAMAPQDQPVGCGLAYIFCDEVDCYGITRRSRFVPPEAVSRRVTGPQSERRK